MRYGDVLGLLWMSAVAVSACSREPPHSIVPVPRSFETGEGVFVLDAGSALSLLDPSDTEAREVVELWAGPVRVGTGLALPLSAAGALRVGVDGNGGPESYRLTVSQSGISIVAGDHSGLFYGLQTLSQLLPPGLGDGAGLGDRAGLAAAPLEIPSVRIDDAPRFSHRGMHLDVARHFFGPDFVKRYIDMLARYKINRFHWHLTEDQGWRIQIDRYPRLTQVGAYRAQTHVGHGRDDFNGDGQRYGGFYTKDEIRDIVAYAEARYVTIIPEIEMPGHSLAALAAYPELACTPGPFEVGMTWGVFEDIYCPSEETFAFLQNVLSEVIELFPGELIHVGGDEAPKERWEESELVQRLKEREGLADEHEVQSWFIQRIERYLNANGRRLIGWDEILDGGLAPDAGGHVVEGNGRRNRGGQARTRRHHDSVQPPLPRLLPNGGPGGRAVRDRWLPTARYRLLLRARPDGAHAHRGEAHPRSSGERLDGIHDDGGPREVHGLPPHVGTRRGRMVAQRKERLRRFRRAPGLALRPARGARGQLPTARPIGRSDEDIQLTVNE